MNPIAPINAGTPLTEDAAGQPAGFVTTYFRTWLLSLTDLMAKGAVVLKTLTLTTQAASLVTTAVATTKSLGLYRLTYYVRVTQAATTSSSLTVTLGWLESAVALSQAFAAIVGNTIGTVQSGSVLVRADAQADLTLATTYVSVGGVPMQYRIDVTVEQVG